ncbi:release factor glutamine methyltransferase [Sporomusaceae bacterium BoRhaA]|uniref:peptide chain release factor N(5)-glutamine methyltransferase n=1 Tax=Pelorhabdus rhamnosifermentans TaxID=2772457 RepID=UPI001C063932|nr:peptide chain release factor N(5)-glutamine methyltransferase [Pelorhabdus rhamnosifermentans]MBU2702146.1 release factor glutamine methyltransferase [Pelorhabdus rhamnosifermentans]
MATECWTISRILSWTKQYFTEKGVASPRLDAEVLLSHVLKTDRIHLYVHFDQPLQSEELQKFRQAVRERALRQPVAYIIGRKEFMGLDFIVSPHVLIPRPDTEILVETAQKLLSPLREPRLADVGTGSGAIIVSLLHLLPDAQGVAVDISEEALAVAQQNARRHAVRERVEFLEGNMTEPLTGTFDAILSNPPYIPDEVIATLEPEVRREPVNALAGGKDGLNFYRHLIKNSAAYLNDNGFLAIEIGQGQARDIQQLVLSSPLIVQSIHKDYAGIERVIILAKKKDLL